MDPRLAVMQIAATLTLAACGSDQTGMSATNGSLPPLDAQKARNLHVWETFRVFFGGVAGAFEDTAPADGWNLPSVPALKA